MTILDFINHIWLKFLNLFPPSTHLLVTSIVLIAIIVSFISLFQFNPLAFIIILIIFLPILWPIIVTFFTELINLLSFPKSNPPAALIFILLH